jgi:thiol-disulfide isomerase/thioredoxin
VFHGADGRTVSLDQFKGEVVVLSFWASWCKPCQKELPSLDALQSELAPKGGRVMAVSIDSDARSAERFAKIHSIRMPVYPDGPDGLARELDLPHIPYTIVLDRTGEVVYTSGGGAVGSLNELTAVARKLAATPQLASQTAGGNTP